MKTRIALFVSLLMIGFGIGTAVGTPAMADSSCPTGVGEICLNQAENYAQEMWRSSFNNINLHSNHCLSIPPATWSNGTPVSGNSGSMKINGASAWSNYSVIIFIGSPTCNTGATHYYFNGASTYAYPDLHTINAYHGINSIQILPLI